MKIGQFFKKMVGGSMILAALACPVFNSCADFGADIEDLKGELSDLEDRVQALEQKLNTDLQALQSLLEGKINVVAGDLADLEGKVNGLVTVKECKKNAKGEYELTLSDGTKFTVYPKFEQDYKGIVTTVTLDGVLYWAMFDAAGTPKAITDSEGNLVPVVDTVPQTKKGDDGYFYVSFDGGQTWEPTGVSEPCVFSGIEVVYTDNYTDEEEASDPDYCVETPIYAVLTLADGNTITVTIDGAASFMFGNPYLGAPTTVQYIPCGTTASIQIAGTNIESWIKEVPAGWVVEEKIEDFAQYGMGEFVVTAPSAEAIQSGAAAAQGTMKVLAIAAGGKSITAQVVLTTKAFSGISAGKGNVTVNMNNGLGGYLLGVSKVDEFDADAIVAELKSVVEAYEEYEDYWSGEMVKEYTWSPWYVEYNDCIYDDNYMDSSIEDFPLDSPVLTLQTELELGEQYVVWAVGLNMDMVNYCYTVGDIATASYLNANITLLEDETVVAFNGIEVAVKFEGVTSFFSDFSEQYPGYVTTAEEIIYNINESFSYGYAPDEFYVDDEYVDGWDNGVFTGSPVTLIDGYQKIQPGKTYYFYLVPAVPGKTVYTTSDIYWYEFTTESLISGSSIAVTAGEPVLEYKKITVPVSAEGAVYIYYKYVEPEMVSTIEDKAEYLLNNGTMVEGASTSSYMANLSPSVSRVLLAMAVDQYGAYGSVFQQEYTTKAYVYAEATVAAELQGTPEQTGNVKVSSTVDVDTYYYWYGTKDSYQWTNTSYLGGSVESASAFIALTPDSYLLKKVTPATMPAEGIKMTGLSIGEPHIFVVSAKLADGTFTKATLVEFEPAMDLGTFVYATDDNGNPNPVWEAAKPTVTYNLDTVGDFTNISWSVSVPAGYTAVTTCFSSDFLTDYPTAKDKVQFILSYPYIDLFEVIEGERYTQAYASKGYNIYTVVCDAEGNYYETYVETLNITGGFGV